MAPGSSIPIKGRFKKDSPKRSAASRNSQATPFKSNVVETKGNLAAAISFSYEAPLRVSSKGDRAVNKTIDATRKSKPFTSLSFVSNGQREAFREEAV